MIVELCEQCGTAIEHECQKRPSPERTSETWYELEKKRVNASEWEEVHGTYRDLDFIRKMPPLKDTDRIKHRIVRKALTTEVIE